MTYKVVKKLHISNTVTVRLRFPNRLGLQYFCIQHLVLCFQYRTKEAAASEVHVFFPLTICYRKYKHSPSKDSLVHKVSFPSLKKGVQHLILWDFWFSSLPSIKILMKVITKFCLLELIRTLFFFFYLTITNHYLCLLNLL